MPLHMISLSDATIIEAFGRVDRKRRIEEPETMDDSELMMVIKEIETLRADTNDAEMISHLWLSNRISRLWADGQISRPDR